MKRIILICTFLLGVFVSTMAQEVSVVKQFGQCLSDWATSRVDEADAIVMMQGLCSETPAFRIGDSIMHSLAEKNGYDSTNTFLLASFITCIQKEISEGVSIDYSNIKTVSENQVDKSYRGFKYAYCHIRISGSSNLDETALFIIKNNKIAKIQNYETTSKHKVKIDWSGLDVDEYTDGIGLSYNYNKYFPIGFSLSCSKWKMMLSLDFGVNLEKDLYTTRKVDFNNVVDYNIVTGEYDLKYFVTLTPSFYLKYFAVGWGFGYAELSGTKYTESYNVLYESSENQSTRLITQKSSTGNDYKLKFMMRPSIKGFIPCSDNVFISLSVSYDWIVGYNKKSGISFGVGVNYLFD